MCIRDSPGTDQYVLGTPLFKRVILHLENGKDFTIDAPVSYTHLDVYKRQGIAHPDFNREGPGFESQRDHKKELSNRFLSLIHI